MPQPNQKEMDEDLAETMDVMIVEDDPSTRKFYEEVSKAVKLNPACFCDAESAWEEYCKRYYPILILDWLLPAMDGLELCKKIRSVPQGEWSVILVATVKSKIDDLKSVLKAGANDYIAKPMDLGLLKIRLEIAKNEAMKLRNARLAEEQAGNLRAKIVLAEKLMSVQGMVSGVSHELNNPLQGILGLSELLADDAKEDNIKKDLELIRQLAEQCKAITHDLLIFSEGDDGARSEIGLNTLINRFLDIWEKKLLSENIEVKKHLDQRDPKVSADLGRLNQVFFHLCQNAVQAMPSGGMLTIETELDDLSCDSMIEIRFKDTGDGMSPEVLNRVFDPFFTTKEVGKGRGLGLSVCHGIVREYGGHISALSEGPGKGSTILVRLPVTNSLI